MTICYVADTDDQGWLRVKMRDGLIWPLPKYLKLEFIKREANRDQFKILEGRWRGTKASVSRKADGRPLTSSASYILRGEPPRTPAATVKLDIGAKQFWYGTVGPVDGFTDPRNPIPKGTHDLEIPYEPHGDYGRPYLSHSPFATTWLRIGHSGDRFLHPGRVSEGCATINALDHWTTIYRYLIKARKDLSSVGTIEVV